MSSLISLKAACLKTLTFNDFTKISPIILDDLISHPDINLLNDYNYGQTLLTNACISAHLELVKFLLSKGVDPSCNGNLAIRMLCGYNYRPLMDLVNLDLIKNRSYKETETSRTEILKILLCDPRVDPSVKDNLPLKAACAYGYTDLVQLLILDPRVDPCADKTQAIAEACTSGHTEIVKLLFQDKRVKFYLDKDNNGDRLASLSGFKGFLDILELVFTYTKVSKETIHWLLQSSCEKGYIEVIKFLKDKVEDTSELNKAFKETIYSKHYDISKLLLSDPRVSPYCELNSVLSCAVRNKQHELVKLLLKYPEVNPADPYLLKNVVQVQKNKEAFEILISDPRVDPSLEDNILIYLASINQCFEMIKILLLCPSVDPLARSEIAVRTAMINGNKEITDLILNDPRVLPIEREYLIHWGKKHGYLKER